MLKGDLATTPLPEVLRTLAESAATGCLRVKVAGSADAKVFLRTGRVYAVVLPDRRPQLGPRLVSSGDLDPSALAEAYDAQATELQGWRLGELLVHLGYVEQDVVEAAVGEQVREAAFELLLWTAGTWRFRVDERTREDVAPPVSVDDLLADVAQHAPAWEALRPHVHGPDAVPVLSAAGTSPETLALDGDAWSLLCTVDGTSSLSELAGSSGLSLLEAAQVVVTLVEAGLVEIEPVDVGEVVGEVVDAGAPQPVALQAVVAPVTVEPVAADTPAEAHLVTDAPHATRVLSLVPDLAGSAATVAAAVEDDEDDDVQHIDEIEPLEPDLSSEPVAPFAIASRLAEALRGLGPMPVLAPLPDLPALATARPEAADSTSERAAEPTSAGPTSAEPATDAPEPAAAAAPAMVSTAMDGESLTRSLPPAVDDLAVAGSLSRASASLSVTLGETDEPFDPFDLPLTAARGPQLPALDEREAKRRAHDKQDLADRHAALEAERAAALKAERAAALEAERAAALEAERAAVLEAERAERAAEQARADHMRAAREAMAELLNDSTVDTSVDNRADTATDTATDTAVHAAGGNAVADDPAPTPHRVFETDPQLAAQWQAEAFAELSEAASAVPSAEAASGKNAAPLKDAAPLDPAAGSTADPTPRWEQDPAPGPYPLRDTGRVVAPPPGADTAALLRELSSLGLEDERHAVADERAAAPQVVRPLAAAAPKKRKGLFGRG